ncbi:hypothetical protein [Parasitella parasitica]|uniref:Uncharacterized protein n=1 Tax=Parasitella parasitica TaxID=35722 RepID=A0A0B7NDT3_9FUNG|nr:hypothetical protein [Parasitella parasitica]
MRLICHIKYFLETWRQSKKRSQSSKAKEPDPVQFVAVEDHVPNCLDSNGRFSEKLISAYESNLTEIAYGDTIKSRSHNTSITYYYKQVEFLFFYKKVYAGDPAISRFQVRDTKLLVFLGREFVEREIRKAGEILMKQRYSWHGKFRSSDQYKK